ncbi:T-cell receptor alpha chain V region PY14 [Anabarilius grahami]|nr:T-cell receptor alpha chain V region PY14 [Anabarilius grahami]
MMLLGCLLVFAVTQYTFAQSIRPLRNNVHVTEEEPVTLSCKYNGSANSLHWYRQYPGSRPEFVLLVVESQTKHITYAVPRIPGMDGKMSMKDKQVDLEISSPAVSDSALYYCALEPTVTGNTRTLYKNLYKEKQHICLLS